MRLLCVVENAGEAAQLSAVGRLVHERSHGQVDVEYGVLDQYLFQGAGQALRDQALQRVIDIPIAKRLKKPLPYYNLVVRTAVQYLSRRKIEELGFRYDGLISGVNYGLIRMLLLGMRKLHKPGFLILGFIDQSAQPAPLSRREWAKRLLRRIVAATIPGASYLNPTGAGDTEPPQDWDRIFVAGEGSCDALLGRGVASDCICVTGIPRLAGLFPSLNCTFPQPEEAFSLLYVVGAFQWHGMQDGHERQQQQLRILREMFTRLPKRFRLVVRLHPRDTGANYDWIPTSDGRVSLQSGGPLSDQLRRANLVLGQWSMALIECLAFGVPSVSILFPKKGICIEPRSPHHVIEKVSSAADLEELILQIGSDERAHRELFERELPVLKYHVAEKTPISATAIADEIVDVCRGATASLAEVGPQNPAAIVI